MKLFILSLFIVLNFPISTCQAYKSPEPKKYSTEELADIFSWKLLEYVNVYTSDPENEYLRGKIDAYDEVLTWLKPAET